MKPSDAVAEINVLLNDAAKRGGLTPSEELRAFLQDLEKASKINVRSTNTARSSRSVANQSAKRRRQPDEADVSKTIDDLANKLRAAFNSDERFEAVIREPQTQKLSKSNVVSLYQRVFDEDKGPAKSLTKPDLFNAIRRERIRRVRAQ